MVGVLHIVAVHYAIHATGDDPDGIAGRRRRQLVQGRNHIGTMANEHLVGADEAQGITMGGGTVEHEIMEP
jgi:hypothetical protein